jgi:four helix bundle protein
MHNFRRLKIVAKAKALAVFVYRVTGAFPKSEMYGMTSQMRRAATGIGLAIVEGCGRGSTPDLIRFLRYANASAQELEYAADLAIELRLGDEAVLREIMRLSVEIQKMIYSWIERLNNK